MFSSSRGLKEKFLLSSRSGIPLWTRRNQNQSPHTLKRNRRNCGPNKVDCGGSEPSSSFHPHRHLQRITDEQNEDYEETEDETDGDDGGRSEPDMNLVHMESLLEEHMDTYTRQKLVGSSECEATFSQKKNMTQETNSPRDMMKNTDLSLSDGGCKKKLYHCSVCAKTFCWKSHLEIHMTSHTGEKRFKCSLCHKCFRQKSNLKRHMRVHTGEKPFNCSVCQKRFTCNSSLTGHMIIHTGEKPFSCSECGKRFTWKIVLERHMRLHTGEKPFSCSECGKRFSQKTGLERHMTLHTGERPFSCVVCQTSFTRKQHVQNHMKIHTNEDRI
uniref:C2H2-type domain-containing protein n=2 Tax=Sphaeramia orbicularis TaxID=375764 RepID=A0A672ZGJ8_9TELE